MTNLTTHQECGEETNSGLTNPGDSGPGDGAQVVDHVGLGHPDTGVDDGEGLGISVQDDLDEELLLVAQLAGVSQGLVTDLVQGIGGVGDQVCEEDLFAEG